MNKTSALALFTYLILPFLFVCTYGSPVPLSRDLDSLSNSTSSEIICIYPLSGYYAGLQRLLYWIIIIFTIIGLGHPWMIGAAFGTAMTYSSVAVVHAIALYAARSHEYYDPDPLAIWEVIFCTSVLLPGWLTHYDKLKSDTAQIVLRLWGLLLFIGGVITICQLTKVNVKVTPQSNSCVPHLPSNISIYDVTSWNAQTICDWSPCANAVHPMRQLSEVQIARSEHALAKKSNTIATVGTIGGVLSLGLVLTSIFWPASDSLDKHRASQARKQRQTKRNIKGNHPGDTCQLPLAMGFGVAMLVLSEVALSLVPVSEGPESLGQWGPWVALALVLVAVVVNRYFEAPVGDMMQAMARALGPTIWYAMEWRGNQPSPKQRRQEAAAAKVEAEKARRKDWEKQVRAKYRTADTQTEGMAKAGSGKRRRNSTGAIGDSIS